MNSGICTSNCIIYGEKDRVSDFAKRFEKRFYLSDIVKVTGRTSAELAQDMLLKWGTTESRLDLIGFISLESEPTNVICAYYTDTPISEFWRNVSEQFQITVEYEYIDSEYAGREVYNHGECTERCYTEDVDSNFYLTMKEKYSDYGRHEEPRIIPMSDIMKGRKI